MSKNKKANIIKSVIGCAVMISIISSLSYARKESLNGDEIYFSRFQDLIYLNDLNLKVPSVVGVSIYEDYNVKQIEVYNKTVNIFIPTVTIRNNKDLVPYSITSEGVKVAKLNDDDYNSSIRYEALEESDSKIVLNFKYQNKIKTTHLKTSLSSNVSAPKNITIKYLDNGIEKIALSKTVYNSSMFFPEVESDEFIVEIIYAQPLVVSEIGFNYYSPTKLDSTLRFLARPGDTYVLYLNPESYISIPTGEVPDLYNGQDIIKYNGELITNDNPVFKLSDLDNDTVPDITDNCVNVRNAAQEDANNNGRGDACEDYDRDGVINSLDNCISDTNRYQEDVDHDGVGDICDQEESRLTEKYKWLPWVGVISAIVLIGGLGYQVFSELRRRERCK